MNKLKIFKSVSAIALMGTITLTGLTGCAEKSFLSDTNLENTRVISFEDGHKDIAVIQEISCHSDKCNCTEKVYRSIITNEYFTNDICKSPKYNDNYGTGFQRVLIHYDIINSESIISYLTTDEIVKAAKEELTENDTSNIINRIFTKEKTNEKVR